MLDTRLEGSEKQSKTDNADKLMISDSQLSWMENKLVNSKKQWKFLVQQIMMAQVPVLELNNDQWSSYKDQRKK